MAATPSSRRAAVFNRSLPPRAPLLPPNPLLRPGQGHHGVRQVLVAERARLVLPLAARVEAEESHRVVRALLAVVPPDAGLDVSDQRHDMHRVSCRVPFLLRFARGFRLLLHLTLALLVAF